MVQILDGKWLAAQEQKFLRQRLESQRGTKRAPGLGVILVGDNPASQSYVASKEKMARACGFITKEARLASSADHAQVQAAIEQFNRDPEIDGILLQLPLPAHLDSHSLLDCILPRKDADGLHPHNQGLLLRGRATRIPCTPLGVLKLLDLAFSKEPVEIGSDLRHELPAADFAGLRAVVIGRSILVGQPLSLLLLQRNATVLMAHSKSPQLPELVAEADIVVAAVGRPELVKKDWIQQGAVVIDVGINRVASSSGSKLVGDVAYAEVFDRCRAITPVPGGVGPMTVSMLLYNTLKSYEESTQ